MMTMAQCDVVIALGKYADAVIRSTNAVQHGTHGDGTVTAAFNAESDAYRAVLALVAPDVLAHVMATEIMEAAHHDAQSTTAGIAAVERTFGMLEAVLGR